MVKNNGMGIAMTRLASYYTNTGMFDELTNGLTYYRFVTGITDNFDSKQNEIIANLEKTASLLFRRNNLLAGVTCSDENYDTYSKDLKKLTSELPDKEVPMSPWKFNLTVKNEGLRSTSKVQYVVKGYDFKKLGYEWNGRIKVLNQVLSTDYLQTQIRVLGGAYGGFSGFSVDGQAYFASYRDPNLKETLENYNKAPEFLHEFMADTATMTRYIIGTIARMDRPMTASQKGGVAFGRWLRKETPEQLKKERAEVLSTTDADIRDMEKMVRDILDKNVYCVYGNEQKINENKKLFKSLVDVVE
jgi:Zn-dependent M16 (insulinase) family peptidase